MTAIPAPAPYDAVPAELRDLPQWVTWDYEQRGEKRTKVPRNPVTGALASSSDPATWGTFGQAQTDLEWGRRSGIGFVLSSDDPYFFVDLDSAIDIDVLAPWASEIVDRFPACYWEVSPSGAGLHAIGRGVLPPGGNRKGQIEVYDRGRFATITGNVWDGHDTIGAECTDVLTAWHGELFQPVIEAGTAVVPPAASPPLTDDEVLHRALDARNGDKLRRILSGDISDYASASEADAAAALMLKFWSQDRDQIGRLLRLSGLQRDKWDDHKTYLDRTVDHALGMPGATYAPASNIVDIRKHLNGSGGAGDAGDGSSGDPDAPVPGFRLSDLGNGQRLAKRITGKAHWCKSHRSWFVYDGQRWNTDSLEDMMRWSQESVLAMYDAVSSLADKDRTALLKHAMRSESERALNAAINQARPDLAIRADAFDTDPMVLNVKNGTIDLRTGVLCPHDPAQLIAKLAPVTFDPDATCPQFLAFLDQIFEGDQERIAYLKRALGYCLTGDTRERAVFIAYGSGRNGKTTLSRLTTSILGDYAKRTPTETIMASRNSGSIPNDIAALVGSRFVTVSETEEGRRLNVSKVKDLAGDEVLVGCFKYGEFFEFRPQFKLWISTNHKPVIPGNDRAIFDRFHLLPFDFRVPEEHVDKTLEGKLKSEDSGIFNWMLEGCLEWQKSGLRPPDTVRNATEQYRIEMDQIGSFFADRCVIGREFKVTSGSLYAAYKSWCEVNGEKQIASNWFGRQVAERGYAVRNDGDNRARTWFGIGLIDNNDSSERHYTVQNGISKEVIQKISHKASSQEMPFYAVHPQNAVHPSRDKESEDDGWQ